MKINLTEAMRLKGRLVDIHEEMDTIFRSVNTNFDEISSNINSSGLHQSILGFQGNVSALSQKFSQNLEVLENFMDKQISSYTVTNEEVEEALQNLISKLNETFDKDGNILSNSGSANPTDTSTLTPTVETYSTNTNINPPMERHLTKAGGVFQGPSGKETYYNLPMNGVVNIMRNQGYSEAEYPYWVRDDGAKMLGDYVMVAADFNTRPRGTILETSLGTAIVCDTGTFAQTNPSQVDIAIDTSLFK